MNDISHAELLSVLHYDPSSGVFVWNKTLSNAAVSGARAGSFQKTKHRQIQINGKKYKEHRLAWLYIYGKMPEHEIDHINGNPSDNRICNLRDVTHRENGNNLIKHRKGKLAGCYYSQAAKAWLAQIQINGKWKYLGKHPTEKEAHEAYLLARSEHNI